MQYKDIDWNQLWQEARQQKSWKKKKKTDWDKRATTFAKRNIDSGYAEQFIHLMEPDPQWRVLDIGSGPGTLALPMSSSVRAVTAVDFSPAMLAELNRRIIERGINNIRTVQACWTDDWQQQSIEPHEVAISSRSMSVYDLKGALEKLNNWATHKVFIADRVSSGPFDPELFAALGRSFDPGPDYIYTVNLLYQMGIHPTIDYILLDQTKTFACRDDALESCRWMFDDLTTSDERNLAAYVDERLERTENGDWTLVRRSPVKWAFISWQKKNSPK